jgi:hypothetical protein
MLHRVRGWARPLAVALLVSLAGSGAWTRAWHSSDCHDVCAVSSVPHDPAAHVIRGAPADDSHTLHCVACHWARSFRPPVDAAHQLAPPTVNDIRLHVQAFAARSLVASVQPPLRAPPIAPAETL